MLGESQPGSSPFPFLSKLWGRPLVPLAQGIIGQADLAPHTFLDRLLAVLRAVRGVDQLARAALYNSRYYAVEPILSAGFWKRKIRFQKIEN